MGTQGACRDAIEGRGVGGVPWLRVASGRRFCGEARHGMRGVWCISLKGIACCTAAIGHVRPAGRRSCRSPVSRILSTSCEAGRPFLSPRRSGAPCLRRVRLIPGNERTGSPFPVLSCTTRGLPCRPVTRIRGGLLLHHFTLACVLADHRRYLSAALSVRVPRGSRPSLS